MTTEQFIEEGFKKASKEKTLDRDSFREGAEYVINHLINKGKL